MTRMQIIPTSIHGIIDILYSAVLLLAPNLFNLRRGPASDIPRAMGMATLATSALTRYEWGLIKVLPMRMHLLLDVVATIFLAASPWIFGFKRRRPHNWMPHVLIGLGSLPIALLTKPYMESSRSRNGMPSKQETMDKILA